MCVCGMFAIGERGEGRGNLCALCVCVCVCSDVGRKSRYSRSTCTGAHRTRVCSRFTARSQSVVNDNHSSNITTPRYQTAEYVCVCVRTCMFNKLSLAAHYLPSQSRSIDLTAELWARPISLSLLSSS